MTPVRLRPGRCHVGSGRGYRGGSARPVGFASPARGDGCPAVQAHDRRQRGHGTVRNQQERSRLRHRGREGRQGAGRLPAAGRHDEAAVSGLARRSHKRQLEFRSGGDGDAFVYQNGHATDLNSLIAAGSGFTLRSATGINDSAVIAGTASPGRHRRAARPVRASASSSPRSAADRGELARRRPPAVGRRRVSACRLPRFEL